MRKIEQYFSKLASKRKANGKVRSLHRYFDALVHCGALATLMLFAVSISTERPLSAIAAGIFVIAYLFFLDLWYYFYYSVSTLEVELLYLGTLILGPFLTTAAIEQRNLSPETVYMIALSVIIAIIIVVPIIYVAVMALFDSNNKESHVPDNKAKATIQRDRDLYPETFK